VWLENLYRETSREKPFERGRPAGDLNILAFSVLVGVPKELEEASYAA